MSQKNKKEDKNKLHFFLYLVVRFQKEIKKSKKEVKESFKNKPNISINNT
jgi:hypothetical protein